MFALLHQYLVDYSSINLPGIGTMQFANVPACFDHLQIYPSTQKLSFIATTDAETNEQPQLMTFLSKRLDLPEEQAHIMFHHFLDWAKTTIATKNILLWDNIGEFHKTENDKVIFIQCSDLAQYLEPVNAKESRAPLPNNAILVADDEANPVAMIEELEEPITIKRNAWWIWAIAIAVISGALIALKYLN